MYTSEIEDAFTHRVLMRMGGVGWHIGRRPLVGRRGHRESRGFERRVLHDMSEQQQQNGKGCWEQEGRVGNVRKLDCFSVSAESGVMGKRHIFKEIGSVYIFSGRYRLVRSS